MTTLPTAAATLLAAVLAGTATGALAATDGGATAGGGLATGDLVGATLRMAAGLAVVLGLLGVAAWASRRFRISGRLRSGLIEVESGISLGAREKVVLLKVGNEQVLVGISPAGMRTLHVITRPGGPGFNAIMEDQP
jgi:flagellar protein FliO/FliZ